MGYATGYATGYPTGCSTGFPTGNPMGYPTWYGTKFRGIGTKTRQDFGSHEIVGQDKALTVIILILLVPGSL
jgi:hypothetical protein